MFHDDFRNGEEEDPGSLDELLHAYQQLKKGEMPYFLEEEDYELLIEYFFQNNQEAEALMAAEFAQQYYPYSATLLLLRAEILFHGQKHGQALKVLDQVEGLDQNLLDAVLLRSDIFQAQYKFSQAAAFLEEKAAQFEGKEQAELMLELSEVYDECEDYEGVFNTLKRILLKDPHNEEALHKISFWADFAEMHDQSIRLHHRLIDQDPFNALAWFNLGAACQGKKEYEKAIDAYEYCVAIDEQFEFAYRNMADAYMRLNWYEKAIESLEKNLELGKPEDVIFEAMGHCFEKQKNFSKARQYYRQAIALNPADDGIFYRIGETYSREKAWEKAAKSYSTALKINKENAAYFLALGNCLMELSSETEALLCFFNALRLKPQNKSNWTALLKALFIAGYYEEALHQLQHARDAIGLKPDFDYYHAGVLFAMGKSKDAMIHLEQALRVAPQKLKLLTEVQPDLLQRKKVADLVALYKKRKK